MVQEDLLLFSLSFGLLVEQKQEVEDVTLTSGNFFFFSPLILYILQSKT